MRSPWRVWLGNVCVVAAVACFCTGLWLHNRKHAWSGVPIHYKAIRVGDGYFSIYRGGGNQQPITANQYAVWESSESAAWATMALAVPLVAISVWLGSASIRAGKSSDPEGSENL